MSNQKRIQELQQRIENAKGQIEYKEAVFKDWYENQGGKNVMYSSPFNRHGAEKTMLYIRINNFQREIDILKRLEEIDEIEKSLKEDGLTEDERQQLKVLREEQKRLKEERENIREQNDRKW